MSLQDRACHSGYTLCISGVGSCRRQLLSLATVSFCCARDAGWRGVLGGHLMFTHILLLYHLDLQCGSWRQGDKAPHGSAVKMGGRMRCRPNFVAPASCRFLHTVPCDSTVLRQRSSPRCGCFHCMLETFRKLKMTHAWLLLQRCWCNWSRMLWIPDFYFNLSKFLLFCHQRTIGWFIRI